MKLLIGLDIAEKMGVVYHYHGSNTYNCTTYKGTPIEQMQMLEDVVGEDISGSIVFYEQLNTFVNANTTRSLLHRAGYLKNSLLRLGASKVEAVNAIAARKFLGCKDKKSVGVLFSEWGLNQDEADAMAIMLFATAMPLELLDKESIKCLH